ncbi:CHRD domain-containing protein [Hymenobacter sp. BT770]|uniref:CHRD domain-containing protein n=1 Tax=Hymenobacter sp. BT770 TaxID=2886942 RepID=UPI001D12785C|nr:CHRD domain-containing protein [Hymenobacter sp. BT770]MCC3152184.1 CHRD domain-containing protein [Hymenobacter sp. BT770]MDO3413998.1 CHRD domain-containing protein [Hymenobacter sp. BT770]
MLKRLLHSLVAALVMAAPLAASADHLHAHLLLSARMNGAQETPPVSTAAQGVAAFTLNETRDTLFVQAAFSGLSGPITGAHVHEGAVGVAGGIITSLMPMVRGNRISGFLTGADISKEKLAKYLLGQYYINVHTAANPNGEIRGQILVETDLALAGTLNGAQEVPPVATSGTGLGVFTLSQSQDKLKFRVVVSGLSSPITATHFHTGAVGVSGPVVVDLLPFLSNNVIEGEIVPTPAFLTSLLQRQIYINVHTTTNPGGEIRAQVIPETRGLTFDARFDGAQMVPAVSTAAKAVAVARLGATLDTIRVQVGYTGLSGPPLAINFYNSAAGQANATANLLGSVPIAAGAGGNTAGNVTSFELVAPSLNPAFINLLLRGNLNVVLTTAANPNGEVRGQVYRLAREGYTISLNGAQERPTPTTSPGYGVGIVSIDRDQTNAHFMSVWGGLTGPATMGHFHTGLSTQAGPVVFNLAPYFDNAAAPAAVYGYWTSDNTGQPFTLRRSLQFRADSMYMNLHTAAFPGGEIRGQVYRGARNLQRVLATRPALVVAGTFGTAPNPFSTGLMLSFESRAAGAGQLCLTDVLGRPVASRAVPLRPGLNSMPLALPSIAPGLYLLTLQVGDSRLVTRVAKE